MSRFTGPLRIEELADGRTWVLLEDLVWEVGELGSGRIIRVPARFTTDGASVPTIALPFTGGRFGKFTRAATLHDWLYFATQKRDLVAADPALAGWTRRTIDAEFLLSMKALEVIWWRRDGMWLAVRIAGGWAYRGNAKKTLDDKMRAPDEPTVGAARTLPAV